MLFDKEFEFKGKHATYCRFLKNEIELFKTFREVYTVSAIIGFLNATKSEKDVAPKDGEKVQPASILPSELAQKRPALTYIYRLIMLLDVQDGYTIKDYQNRTFRDDVNIEENPQNMVQNMDLFNSYVLGGLEILYDTFKECKTKKETINTLNEFLTDFYEDNGLI